MSKRNRSVAGFIYARLGSTRLPGKVLKAVGGKPMIDWVIEKTLRAGLQPVLLTSAEPVDDPLAAAMAYRGIDCFRGAHEDVARRTFDCLQAYPEVAAFARINGDSPLLDKELLNEGLQRWEKNPDSCAFVTNLLPRRFPYGVSVEIVDRQLFTGWYPRMQSARHREHLTSIFYDHLDEVPVCKLEYPFGDDHQVRLVVDTEEDLLLLNQLIERNPEKDFSALSTREITDLYKAASS